MSKESDREVKVLRNIVCEGEKYDHQFSFRAFEDVMNSEWTRRKAEG